MADNLNSGQTASDTQAVILASTTKQDISQARQVQLDAASDVLLRSATLKSTGSPTLSDLTATNIYYKPDGTLVIVTQSGKEVTTNRDDQEFYAEKNNERTLIVREQNNEIEAYKVWAQEQGYYKLGQTDFIRSLSDLQKDPYYKDFQRYGSELESRTGIKPFSTPYQNYLDNKTLQDTTLEDTPRTRYPQASVVDPFVNSGRRVTGSAALASDELAALKRAIGTNNSNQQQVNQQLGLAPISAGRQAAAFFAQRASDSARYGPDVSQEPDTVNNRYSDAQQENSDMANLDQANQVEGTDVSGAAPRQVQLRPNPLDEYQSHSYTISLHVLTQDEYNSMVSTDKTGTFTPSNTLIAGAGASSADSGQRAKGWEDNFYFESLKLSSVIGLNSTARGTNVIDCEFTIVEPYGLSLIDRLSVTTSTLGGGGLYFSNCYLIEINFYSSEGGKLMDMKKFIPIRLTGMTIKASAKGSEYRCTAVPFSHHALTQTRASTPANFEVTAGTLQEFFQGDDDSSSQAAAEGARELTETQNAVQGSFERTGEARKVDTDKLASLSDKVYAVNSYVAAYNQWQQTLIDLKATQLSKPNKITVVFDKKFLENEGSKVYRPRDQDGSVGTSAMANGPDAKNGDNVRANATKDRFIFAAGTQITEVINIAMKQSEFIRRQIVQQDQAKAGGQKEVQGKVTWWKIIPSVKLREFDAKNNQWSFDSTYYVIPYQVWNTVHPFLPKAIPDRGLCSKEYMYYYTGQNVNVIDFAIDFDFMFFTKVTALREKNTGDQYKAELDENPQISAPGTPVKKGEGFNPGVITHVTDDPKTAGQKARGDPVAMAVASASESLYSSAAGEMLNITLKVIGDPELIKQDDVFTGVTSLINLEPNPQTKGLPGVSDADAVVQGQAGQTQEQQDPTANNNGSIIMDAAEVVCWVEIKTPVDIDDETGGVRFLDNNKVKSGFTGVYKLLMVDSEFNRGMFTQTLNMIRYMNQDFAPVEDRSYDQAEANRLSNYSDNSAQQPSDGNSSQVKISGPAGASEELTIEQTNAVIINKITSPTWTATPLPGGQLVEYRTTVR
jgi:hypothetical protein